MTDRWLNIPLGSDLAENVSEGASDTAQFMAVRITYDATGATREMAFRALKAAEMYLLTDTWPPA